MPGGGGVCIPGNETPTMIRLLLKIIAGLHKDMCIRRLFAKIRIH